ncbi:MAG: zinc ribbon domain-containing protein [Verrucomicrobiales bacterium]|nr:zinc ribbon domain-containing protein [Verrucomicrobiales bacterium]
MPIYEYVASDPEDACPACRRGFEIRRPLTRPPLETCPVCKKPVKKLLSKGVTSPQIAKPLSVSDAKKAGFTVLEKRDEGTYEKL